MSIYAQQEDGTFKQTMEVPAYGIQKDGHLALIPEQASPSKRPYTPRGLGDTSQKKNRFYHNARRRALTKLKERHEQEFEALFAEQLRRLQR